MSLTMLRPFIVKMSVLGYFPLSIYIYIYIYIYIFFFLVIYIYITILDLVEMLFVTYFNGNQIAMALFITFGINLNYNNIKI